MARVHLVHDTPVGLRRAAVERVAAFVAGAGHAVTCSWRWQAGPGRLAAFEDGLERADWIVLVDPMLWWDRWSAASPYAAILRERLEFDARAGLPRYAFIVDRQRAGTKLGGVFAGMSTFALPTESRSFAAWLEREPPKLAALPQDPPSQTPAPLVAIDAWLERLDAAVERARSVGGGLVWIRGVAGSGKSVALAAWMTRRAEAGEVVAHHRVRPAIAATRDPQRIAAKLQADATGSLAVLDGLSFIDELEPLAPLWGRGRVLVAAGRPLAPGRLAVSPALDLEAASGLEVRRRIVAGLLGSEHEAIASAGANPGVAADLRRGPTGSLDVELERSWTRMRAGEGEGHSALGTAFALLLAAASPVPRGIYEAITTAEERARVQTRASEWLDPSAEAIAWLHPGVAAFLAAELDTDDPGLHLRIYEALADRRRRGPLDDASAAYVDAHARMHRLLGAGLDPNLAWIRDVASLQALARGGELERRLELASEDASEASAADLLELHAIVRRHRTTLELAPERLASRIWTELVAGGREPAELAERFDWGEALPPLRLGNAHLVVDRCERLLVDHERGEASLRGCAIDAEAERAITVDSKGVIVLWSLTTAERLWSKDVGLWIDDCALTRDARLAFIATEARVLVYDLDTREEIERHEDHGADVETVAISADGRIVLSGDDDGRVIVWDRARGTRTALGSHRDRVTCSAVSPDGRVGITGSNDQRAIVWDLEAGVRAHTLGGHEYAISGVALTSTGAGAVTVGIGLLRIWNAQTGELVLEPPSLGRSCAGVAIVADDRELLLAEADERVFRVHLATGQILRRHVAHGHDMRALAATPDGDAYLTIAADNLARLWRSEALAEVDDEGYVFPINVVAPDRSGRAFWLGGIGIDTRKHASDGRELVAIDTSTPQDLCDLGDRIAVVGSEKRVELYSLASLERVDAWEPTGDWLRAVDASADQTWLAYAGDDELVRWRNLETGERGRLEEKGVQALRWLADGRLVGVDNGGWLRVWSVDSGQSVLAMAVGSSRPLCALAVDRAGRRAFVGGNEQVVHRVTLEAGRGSDRFAVHRGTIRGLALARDERALVSASEDGSVCVWDIHTGVPLARVDLAYGLTGLAVVDDVIVVGDRVGDHSIFEVDWDRLGLP